MTDNVFHSSESNSWMTPVWLIDMVKEVFGSIGLDPASSSQANERVGARTIYTKETNGLNQPWFGSIFINPPGGKVPKGQPNGNKSLVGLFWKKLMNEREQISVVDHAIFLFFSIEGLANTQGKPYLSAMDFPLCVPAKRIKFDTPEGPGDQPTHSNAIVYVPGLVDETDRFIEVFSRIGKCKR